MYTYIGKVTGCYNCTERKIGCHSNCKIYENYKKEKDLINKRRNELKILDMRSNYGRRKSKTA